MAVVEPSHVIITELVIDCHAPERLADFWCEVLGYVVLGRDDGIEIGPLVDEPKTAKLRLHFDVNATDRDQDAELERLLAAGARRADIGQTGEESWVVLADPEGNEFCLLRRRVT